MTWRASIENSTTASSGSSNAHGRARGAAVSDCEDLEARHKRARERWIAGQRAARDGEEASLQMLLSSLYTRRPGGEPGSLPAALVELREQPEAVDELQVVSRQLLETTTAVSPASVLPGVPLQVHCTYTRLEIMCALGERGVGHSSVPQQGVWSLEERKILVLFVTLQKTEKQFSPTTRYRDCSIPDNAISRELFHWESQSATRETSELGQRYVRQRELGWRVLLFVREKSGEAFLPCGTTNYVRHEGERPIQVTVAAGAFAAGEVL